MDELEEPVGFCVFRAVLRNRAQDGLCVVFHDRKLNEVGAVEHDVRRFLERINPFFFRIQHILPVGNGFTGRIGAFVVVAHDAAQPVVAGGNPVVVVQVGAGKRVDENLEFGAFRNVRRKVRIQGMDALDEQNAPFPQLEPFTVVFPQARNKVILRHIYFFPANELHDMAFHEGMVYRVKIVKIVAAVRELGGIGPVHEVVVRAHGHGFEATGLELD